MMFLWIQQLYLGQIHKSRIIEWITADSDNKKYLLAATAFLAVEYENSNTDVF